MTKEINPGCARPTTKVASNEPEQNDIQATQENTKEMNSTMIRVGKPAPDFTAAAYHDGKFTEVSLSDYKGQWVLVCFYPGDYTFV